MHISENYKTSENLCVQTDDGSDRNRMTSRAAKENEESNKLINMERSKNKARQEQSKSKGKSKSDEL